MRNLKKILALVLALVMSLSLMATAGASSFSDVDDSNPYSTAIDVLDALKVFIGYEDGSFQPTGELTRAEAAVLVYRIATGDVEGKYVENYTYMANSKFNDLDNGYGWAKGYINYCQNAEIIKGTSATTFSPGLKVTGYQLMVMVLRTLGYDKAGEFSDPITWELESARKCEQLGMLKNIPNTGDFGNAAPRQMTAEILFRGLLQNTVKYSVMTPGGYTMDATTLGYQKFTLEEVTGVVVANEYADLHRDPDLSGHSVTAPAGVTVLDVNGEKFNINVSTKLEDLGESRTTYTVENGKANGHELTGIALADTGYNDVEETGEPVDNIKTKYIHGSVDPIRYLNFGEAVGVAQATVKFTYQAEGIYDVISAVSETAAKNTFRSKYHLDPVTVPDAQLAATASYAGSGVYAIQYIPQADDLVTNGTITAKSVRLDDGHVVSIVDRLAKPDSNNIPADEQYAWRMEVEPGATYTSFDQEVVQAIFAKASWTPTGIPQGLLVNGQVFRGTQVADDYSDLNTYAVFVDNCVKVAENHVDNNINVNQRGWWLKVVDNDGDGITDYVFQTRYTVAKVSAVNADTGVLTLDTWKADANGRGTLPTEPDDSVNNKGNNITANNYAGDTIEVGDVVYYAYIDGVNQAWKCEVVEGKVETVNRNNKTVKLTGNDTVYNESAVHEHSFSVDIASGVTNMSSTTNMYLYLDKYGNVAAFSQNIAGNIVLLTDGWAQTLKNGTEYAAVIWDRESKSLKQYDITDGGSLFIDSSAWSQHAGTVASANSWNRIRCFAPLNCDQNWNDAAYTTTLPTPKAGTDDVHSILAYMETDGDNARLVPVDAFMDVQRENNYPIAMIDMEKKVPTSAAYINNGTIWHSFGSGVNPYSSQGTVRGGAEVRALANTVYYFVYHTTWTNGANNSNPDQLGASVYVTEVVGAANAANYMTAHGISETSYIEDVYTAATQATGQNTTTGAVTPGATHNYYTANVVVVELDDTYYASNREQAQVFIYDSPVFTNIGGNYLNGWESVCAVLSDGTVTEDLKVDRQNIRNYIEPTTGKLRNGLYYLDRSYRTNEGDVWYILPMTHEQIRVSGNYTVGTIDATYNPIYAGGLPGENFWVTNWFCDTANSVHVDTGEAGVHSRASVHALDGTNGNPLDVQTLTNKETSKYYRLSYNNNADRNATLSDVSNYNALIQPSTTTDGSWNQVLVRRDASGNVIYAVSFAHSSASAENHAQVVWRNSLLSAPGTAPVTPIGVLFFGEADRDNAADTGNDKDLTAKTIRVDHTVAKAWMATAGHEALTVTGVTNWTLTKTGGTPTAKGQPVLADAKDGDATYTLTYFDADNQPQQYTLILEQAEEDLRLYYKDPAAGTTTEVLKQDSDYPGALENSFDNMIKRYVVQNPTSKILSATLFSADDEDVTSTNTVVPGYYAKIVVEGESGETRTFTVRFGRSDSTIKKAMELIDGETMKVYFNTANATVNLFRSEADAEQNTGDTLIARHTTGAFASEDDFVDAARSVIEEALKEAGYSSLTGANMLTITKQAASAASLDTSSDKKVTGAAYSASVLTGPTLTTYEEAQVAIQFIYVDTNARNIAKQAKTVVEGKTWDVYYSEWHASVRNPDGSFVPGYTRGAGAAEYTDRNDALQLKKPDTTTSFGWPVAAGTHEGETSMVYLVNKALDDANIDACIKVGGHGAITPNANNTTTWGTDGGDIWGDPSKGKSDTEAFTGAWELFTADGVTDLGITVTISYRVNAVVVSWEGNMDYPQTIPSGLWA